MQPVPTPTVVAQKRGPSTLRIVLIVAVVVSGLYALFLYGSSYGLGEPGGADTATPTVHTAVTSTPAARATATPTEEPIPDWAAITLKGKGTKVAKFTIPEGLAGIAKISHAGSSNFAVWSVDSSATEQKLLVNEIGRYAGTVLFDEVGHSVAFKIEADGSWTIVIEPVTKARAWDGVAQLTGKGDDVVRLTAQVSGLTTAVVIHDGESNSAVTSYSTSGTEVLVNEIGRYRGEVLMPDGTLLLEVTAHGPWSVTVQ